MTTREAPHRGRADWSLDRPADAGPTTLELVAFVRSTPTTYALPAHGSVVIGRAPECDVCIDDGSISRRHAMLHLDDGLRLEDLGSANGTWLRPDPSGPDTAPLAQGRLGEGQRVEVAIRRPFHVGYVMAIVREAAAHAARSPDVVVLDAAMEALHATARRIGASPINVLLLGETGTGKEVLAEAIHRASPRAAGPFVRLNCAALSEPLLESELFGYTRGAFTGASTDKPGLLEAAKGGTVFLDEIGELPAAIQAKLLRVLEERRVLRVGALQPRAIDVRFVAATCRDLPTEVARGAFRRDLFFRLDGLSLHIPPLRQRRGEIRALAQLFLARASAQMGRDGVAFAADVPAALEAHDWPGNIRELRNAIERAVALSTGGVVRAEHLTLQRPREAAPRALEPPPPAAADKAGVPSQALDAVERRRILEALEKRAGNQTNAAALLGISRRTLINRLERYGILRPRKRS